MRTAPAFPLTVITIGRPVLRKCSRISLALFSSSESGRMSSEMCIAMTVVPLILDYLLYYRAHRRGHALIHPLAFMRNARRPDDVVFHIDVQLTVFDEQSQKRCDVARIELARMHGHG